MRKAGECLGNGADARPGSEEDSEDEGEPSGAAVMQKALDHLSASRKYLAAAEKQVRQGGPVLSQRRYFPSMKSEEIYGPQATYLPT